MNTWAWKLVLKSDNVANSHEGDEGSDGASKMKSSTVDESKRSRLSALVNEEKSHGRCGVDGQLSSSSLLYFVRVLALPSCVYFAPGDRT